MIIWINKSPTLNDDEDIQYESHNFVAFAANFSLEELNQKVSNLNNSLSDDKEDFFGSSIGLWCYSRRMSNFFFENSKLATKTKSFEKELNDLKTKKPRRPNF